MKKCKASEKDIHEEIGKIARPVDWIARQPCIADLLPWKTTLVSRSSFANATAMTADKYHQGTHFFETKHDCTGICF